MMRKLVLLTAALALVSLPVLGQSGGSQTELKTVTGKVVNVQDKPVQKAVVHLKNTKTLVIKTFNEAFSFFRMGYGSAIGTTMLLLTLLFSAAYMYVISKE